MTTDTSKAPERIWLSPVSYDPHNFSNAWVFMKPDDGATEFVRRDLFDAVQAERDHFERCYHDFQASALAALTDLSAMQDRAEKAEATIGLKDALIQEERRVRVRAETARDRLRHVVEGLEAERDAIRAENERLREALSDLVDCTELATGECDWPDGQDPLSRARAALVRKEGT